LIADAELEFNLTYIKSNFVSLPDSITWLESSKICLADAVQIVEEEKNKIHKIHFQVFGRISGYKTIKIIFKILEEQAVSKEGCRII